MDKDNFLFGLIGILVGFISGYLMHEVMATRQPARLLPGQATAAPAAPPGQGMPASEGAPGAADGGPIMEKVRELRARIEKEPNDADAILELANMNFEIRRWDAARELYGRYLELQPDQPDVLSDLGVTYRELGDFELALEIFDRAQQIAPLHWQSRFNEAIVLAFDLQRYEAAEKVLAELERMQPGNPDVARLATEVRSRKNAA